jgi:hypothetical protein
MVDRGGKPAREFSMPTNREDSSPGDNLVVAAVTLALMM